MPKKEKPKIIHDSIEFKSYEELDFYFWCVEAKNYQIISDFKYNAETYLLSPKQTLSVEKKLKTKTNIVDKHLFHEHVYTPDFHIFKGKRWNVLEDKHGLLALHGYNNEFIIDTKGTFQKHDGSRSFSINQKWMYEKYRIYINKIIPEKFFKLTWLPESCRLTQKTKQIKKKYAKCQTLYQKFRNFKS
jgi:hypothetical protein